MKDNNLNIFINSAGEALAHGYRWMAPHTGSEGLLESINHKSELLGDRNAPTMHISREQDGSLLLMLQALPTSRLDPGNRNITNSLAIHAPSSHEAQIRGIAAAYLRNPETFAQKFDANIIFDRRNPVFGWNADFDEIHNSLLRCKPGRSIGSFQSPQQFGKFTATTEENNLYERLADELMRSPLPAASASDVPVLISRDADKKLFAENKVWRGLSDVFEHDGWQGKEVLQHATSASLKTPSSRFPTKLAIVGGSVALATVLGGWIWHVRHRSNSGQQQQVR